MGWQRCLIGNCCKAVLETHHFGDGFFFVMYSAGLYQLSVAPYRQLSI